MKPYYIRFDEQDMQHRLILEQYYRILHGRSVPFADILRQLMRAKAWLIRHSDRNPADATATCPSE